MSIKPRKERITIYGTDTGGAYIDPEELFTTVQGREAIRKILEEEHALRNRSNGRTHPAGSRTDTELRDPMG